MQATVKLLVDLPVSCELLIYAVSDYAAFSSWYRRYDLTYPLSVSMDS